MTMHRIQLDLYGEDLDNLTTHLTHALRAYMTPGFLEDPAALRASAKRIIEEINAASDLVENLE